MTVDQLAYLKCPDKIRAALINMGGPRLSVDEIKARLPERKYVRGGNIEDWEDDEPEPPRRLNLTAEERARIAAWAARIPDKERPKPNDADIVPAKAVRPKQNRVGEAYGADLIRYVLRKMNIPREAFFGGTKVGHVAAAGSMVAVLLRELDARTYSYPKIARILGRRDHTTIIHAVREWPRYSRDYPEYAALYEAMRGDTQWNRSIRD